jgi:hypothetical protein
VPLFLPRCLCRAAAAAAGGGAGGGPSVYTTQMIKRQLTGACRRVLTRAGARTRGRVAAARRSCFARERGKIKRRSMHPPWRRRAERDCSCGTFRRQSLRARVDARAAAACICGAPSAPRR